MRHDMYSTIHKAIRSQLFSVAGEAARVDPMDDASVEGLLSAHARLRGFLGDHAEHEETFIHPKLATKTPELAAALDGAHRELDAQEERLDADVEAIRSASGPARAGAIDAFRRDFERYTAAQLEHMRDEELRANAALWKHYSDDELRVVQGQIQGSIPPARFGQWLEVMLPAMNLNDRAGMFLGIKHGAPPEAFQGFYAALGSILGDDGRAAVEMRAQAFLAAAA